MKRVLLTLLLFVSIVSFGFSQLVDDCTTAVAGPTSTLSTGFPNPLNIPVATFTDGGVYSPTIPAAGYVTAFFEFRPAGLFVAGQYDIVITPSGTNPISGDLSMAFITSGPTACNPPISEQITVDITGSTGTTVLTCLSINDTDDYILAFATVGGGDFTITLNNSTPPFVLNGFTETSGNVDNDGIVCEGDDFTLLDVGTAGSGNGVVSWEWQLDGVTIPGEVNSSLVVTGATLGVDDGVYTVIGTNANGCFNSSDATIVINPAPVAAIAVTETSGASIDDGDVCVNDDFTLTATPTGAMAYAWSLDAGGAIAGATTDMYMVTAAQMADGGTYEVTVTDINGCTDTEQIIVNMNTLPVVSNTTLRECETTPGLGTADFDLTDADLTPDFFTGNSNVTNDIYTGASPVTITYHATLADADADMFPIGTPFNSTSLVVVYARVEDNTTLCHSVAEITLEVAVLPVFDIQNVDDALSITDFSVCQNEPINLTVTDAALLPSPYTLDFTLPDASTQSVSSPNTTLAIAMADVTAHNGLWTVTVTDANGCSGTDDITITVNANPANDVCDVANVVLTSGTVASLQNNTCATEDMPASQCGVVADDDASVWYEIAGDGTNTTLTVTVTGTGAPALTSPVVEVYQDCGVTFEGGTCSYAAPLELNCLDPNLTFRIMVASSAANAGEFDITATWSTPMSVPGNDLCSGATALLPSTPICIEYPYAVTNQGACPEFDATLNNGGCDFTQGPAVWYSFLTNINTTTFTVEVTGITADIGLYSGACGALIAEDCGNGALIMDAPVSGATTYYILVAGSTALDEGVFNLLITEGQTLANDDCAMATALTDGTDLLLQDNNCATTDVNACGIIDDKGVWYSIAPSATAGETTLTVTVTGTGTAITSPNIEVYDACGGTLTGSECTGTGSLVLNCLDPTVTYQILINSTDVNAGEFTINADWTAPPLAPANDVCTGATDIVEMLPICNTYTYGPFDNTNACPEPTSLNTGACDFSVGPAVYFTFTTDATTVEIDIDIVNNAFSADIGLFSGACGTLAAVACGDMGSIADQLVTGGAVYTIVVSGDALTDEGTFDLEITETPNPPTNDMCAGATTLTEATALAAENNSCASDDTNTCGLIDDNSLWYEIAPSATAGNTTLTIDILGTSADALANHIIEVYDACGGNLSGSDCAGATQLVIPCLDPTVTYQIQISSLAVDAGEFSITATWSAGMGGMAPTNDDCVNAEALALTQPICTPNLFTGETNVDACPEDVALNAMGCTFSVGPAVYYTFTTAATGMDELDIEILNEAATLTSTEIGLFTGACGSLSLVACGSAGADIINQAATPGTTYTLVVAGTTTTDAGTFDIQITEGVSVANDLCVNAMAIAVDGTLVGMQNNNCAGSDGSVCGTNDSNSVWYSFSPNAGFENVEVGIAGQGPVADQLSNFIIEVYESCGGTLVLSDCAAAATTTLECLDPNITYVLMVASDAVDAGNFQISLTELDNGVVNETCSSPDIIVVTADCVNQIVNGDNTDACPEDFTGTACDIDQDAVVWHSITLSATANGLEFSNLSPSLQLVLFTNACPLPAIAQDCFTSTTGPGGVTTVNGLTGGATYLIAASFDNAAEGAYSFTFKTLTSPLNDDCVNAEVLASGVTFSGTNQCATVPLLGACPVNQESTVWFEYTVGANENKITIDVTNFVNTPGSNQLSVAAGLACGDPFTLLDQDDGTAAEYCGAFGTELLTLTCLNAGDVIRILVASSTVNEGTFDITVTANTPMCTYTNDECANAIDLGVITTGAACTITPGCNDLACPEAFTVPACGFDLYNSVWYSFTTDATALDAFAFLEILNGETGELDSPNAILLDGTCGTFTSIGACAMGGGGVYNSGGLGGTGVLMPNTTYYVLVSNTDINQDGGTFDLCVEVISGCVNDVACNATILTEGVTETETASTLNCTTDPALLCNPVNEEASAWFTYTLANDEVGVNISINGAGVDPITTGSVQVGDLADCNNPAVPIEDYCAVLLPFNEDISCLLPGQTIYIMVSTRMMAAEGEFDITINGLTPADIGNETNDVCPMATDVPVIDCEMVSVSGNNTNACPDDLQGAPCAWNSLAPAENGVLWYSITTTTEAYGLDIDLTGNGLANAVWGLWQGDCDNLTPVPGPAGSLECVSGVLLVENIAIPTPGDTYYLVVGSSSGGEGGFTLDVTMLVPPENDSPCNTSVTPPVELGGGGSHAGQTCCAVGANDMLGDEFVNADCPTNLDDDAVWYTYTPTGPDEQGFDVEITAGTIMGNTGVEIYTGAPGAGCGGGLTFLQSGCGPLPFEASIPICDPTVIYYIKVASASANCGSFNITTTVGSCEQADECADIGAAEMLGPTTTDPNFETFDEICIAGCLDYACPNPEQGECGSFATEATVWFEVETDAIAQQLFTSVSVNGSWMANWSVYQGDCTNLQVIASGGTPPCSNGDATPELHQTAVEEDAAGNPVTTYYVAVTVDPNTIPTGGIQDGTFELCAYTTINAITCIGDFMIGCGQPDDSYMITVNNRSCVDTAPLDPADGAPQFGQGEEVEICIDFVYDATATGQDWMIGFVPRFGPGWDLTNFDYSLNAPMGNGSPGVWFEENTATAPILQEPVPILGTTVDANGDLQLCNSLCDPDCPVGMLEGDPLPSGYFWVTNGGNTGCANDGSPGEGWGIGAVVATINWCFTVTTKVFDTEAECLENNDLQINLFAFSDGVAGCWEDPVGECLLDLPQFGPPWLLECEMPPMVEDDPDTPTNTIEICNGDFADLPLVNDDGSSNDIQVTVTPNPDVTGEMDHFLTGGFGSIGGNLMNTSTSVQTVVYEAFSIDPDLPCDGPISEFFIVIYPDLIIEGDFEECQGTDYSDPLLSATVSGGSGIYTNYQWAPVGGAPPGVQVGNAYQLTQELPSGNFTYSVTVSDDNMPACTGVGLVSLTINPKVEFEFNPDPVSICAGAANPIVCINTTSGTAPFNYSWFPNNNLLQGTTVPGQAECFEIDAANTVSISGVQNALDVTVTDSRGCSRIGQVEVNIGDGPMVNFSVGTINCGDVMVDVNVQVLPGNSGTNVLGYEVFDPNGVSLGVTTGSTGIFTATMSGNYMIVATDLSGCPGEATVPITFASIDMPMLSGDMEICDGQSATITVDNAAAYDSFAWDDPAASTTSSITVNPTDTTTYIVTVMTNDGCSSLAQFTVNVAENPTVMFSGATTFCPGTSTIIGAGGDPTTWTYNWSNGTPVAGDPSSVEISSPGSVSVTVTDGNMCTAIDQITIAEDAMIMTTVSGGPICDNGTVELDAGAGFDSYQWSDSNGPIAGETNQTFIASAGGLYSVAITQQGCTGGGSFDVMVQSSPVADVTPTAIACSQNTGNGPVSLDFTAYVLGDAGTWANTTPAPLSMPLNTDLTNVDFTGVPAGVYTFTFTTNTAVLPCTDQTAILEVTVSECGCPDATTIAPMDLCNTGGSVTLVNLQTVNTSPGTWTLGTVPMGSSVDITDGIFESDNQPEGAYELIFTVDMPGGGSCINSTTQMINVLDGPDATLIPDFIVCNATSLLGPNVVDFDTLVSGDPGVWVDPMITGLDFSDINNVDFTGVTPGNYTFTFQTTGAVLPCIDRNFTITITVRDCNCPNALTIAIPDLCNDNATYDLVLAQDPNADPGVWTLVSGPMGNTATVTANMFNATGQAAGAYTVQYNLSNPVPGCDDNTQQVINVSAPPSATVTPSTTVCNVGVPAVTNLDFASLITAGDMGGTWTEPSGASGIDLTGDISNVSFDGFMLGTYTFEYTTNSAVAPCMEQIYVANIVVSDCSCPDPSTNMIPDQCNTGSMAIDLTQYQVSNDPGSWTFSMGPETVIITNDTFDPTGLMPGTYTVTFTLTTVPPGCNDTSTSQDIIVSEPPTVMLEPLTEVCNTTGNGNITVLDFNLLILSGDMSGSWSEPSGASGVDLTDPANVDFENIPVGVFTFTYTTNSAVAPCTDQMFTLQISVSDCSCPSVVTSQLPDLCTSGSLAINLDDYKVTTQAGSWGFESGPETVTITNNMFDPAGLMPGNYVVFFQLDTPPPAGCPDSTQQSILLLDAPIAGTAAEPLRICEGETQLVALADLLSGADSGGAWIEVSTTMSTGGAFDQSAGSFNTANQLTGNYAFSYVLAGTAPCPDDDVTVEVIIEGLPVADAGPDGLLNCVTPDFGIGGPMTSTGAEFAYNWTEVNGLTVANDDQASTVATQGGTYVLVVTNTSSMCSASDQVIIAVDGDLPSLELQEVDPLCFGDVNGSITAVNVTGGDGVYEFSIDGGVQWQVSPLFDNLAGGSYTVIVRDGTGCEGTAAASLDTPANLNLDLTASTTLLQQGEEGQLFLTITGFTESEILNFSITENDILLDQTNYSEVILINPTESTNIYVVTIETLNGCILTAQIVVNTTRVRDFFTPNVFNPGSDNSNNSTFFIQSNEEMTVDELLIFDRWGELVFKTTETPINDPAFGWDGTFKGANPTFGQTASGREYVVPGVYVFVVRVTYVFDGQKEERVGDVTVLR